MQEKQLFEYAVIRVVPRVDREEFMNVGVILYCRGLDFLQTRFTLDRDRMLGFSKQVDLEEVEGHLRAICLICEGAAGSGPIGQMGLAERFRWLTAIRSTMVQSSKVHPGFCTDAAQTLARLYEEMVL